MNTTTTTNLTNRNLSSPRSV